MQPPTTIKLGLPTLDRLTGGLKPTDNMYITSKPGAGKTTLLINFAYNILKQGKKVVFATDSETKDEIWKRFSILMNEDDLTIDAFKQKHCDFFSNLFLVDCYNEKSVFFLKGIVCAIKPNVLIIDSYNFFENEKENPIEKEFKKISKQFNTAMLISTWTYREAVKKIIKGGNIDQAFSSIVGQMSDILVFLMSDEKFIKIDIPKWKMCKKIPSIYLDVDFHRCNLKEIDVDKEFD